MGLDASVVAMIEQIQDIPPDDPAAPLMTQDSARGAARLSELLMVDESAAIGAMAPTTSLPVTGKGTLGDAILGKLERIGQRYQAIVDDAHATVDGMKSMSLTELLQVQLKLAATSLEIEVISKGVSKAVQHVDQLTKLQ